MSSETSRLLVWVTVVAGAAGDGEELEARVWTAREAVRGAGWHAQRAGLPAGRAAALGTACAAWGNGADWAGARIEQWHGLGARNVG